MNGLNQMIAQGVQMPKIESPLAQISQIEAIRQAQQTNALRQAQMQQLEREQASTNALNRAYAEAFNPQTGAFDQTRLMSALAESGQGAQIPTVQKGLLEREKARAEASKVGTQAVTERINFRRNLLEGVRDLESYINWSMGGFQDPVLGPELIRAGSTPEAVMQRIQQVGATPQGLQQLIEESRLGSQKFADIVQQRAGQAITVRGQDVQAATTRRGQDIQAETTRRGQDITDRRERDLQLAENMAAAKTLGTELAKNRVAAEAALPGAIATAEQTIGLINEMIGDASVSKDGKKWEVPKGGRQPAPGFQDYVGATAKPFMRLIEGSDAASYERRQLQIEGKALLEAFEILRGGGAISNFEGASAQQAISRANKAQSEVEYVKAMRELQDIARKSVERARKKAGAGGAAPAAGGGVDMNNPLLR